MTRHEVIEEMCSIRGLAYHSIGDFSEPSDGFCKRCQGKFSVSDFDAFFQSGDETIRFIRLAVVEKLKRHGFKIADNFDQETGEEIK